MKHLISHIGFCGSRRLSGAWFRAAGRLAAAVTAGLAPRRVSVGCAPGADSAVRRSVPCCRVFRVSAYGSGRGAYARRSAACVQSVGSGPGSAYVGFVSVPCPERVRPSSSVHTCFCGGGSGTWATLALAVGSGVGSIIVFWCAPGSPSLPSWGGSWVPASGRFSGGWLFVPGSGGGSQLSLF